MKVRLSRREVLLMSGAAVLPVGVIAMQKTPKPPALPDALVKEFVTVGHGELPRVKEMLAEHPTLLNAVYDWGNGDFEMAIGGAGHVGSRETAQYLISQGARSDMFVQAMLGNLSIVKAYLTTYPHLLKSKGPHGLSLEHHAKVGGESAREVLEYVQTLLKIT